METKYEHNTKVFKALCDPNRMMILEMLQSGEQCACHLIDELDIGQSTLSHHMKILCESGIVASRRDAKWTYYRLNPNGCEYEQNLLAEVLTINYDIEKAPKCRCE
jgi:ArsR family transcriptional regulator